MNVNIEYLAASLEIRAEPEKKGLTEMYTLYSFGNKIMGILQYTPSQKSFILEVLDKKYSQDLAEFGLQLVKRTHSQMEMQENDRIRKVSLRKRR